MNGFLFGTVGGTNTDRNAVPGASFDPFSRFSGLYQPSAKERYDFCWFSIAEYLFWMRFVIGNRV